MDDTSASRQRTITLVIKTPNQVYGDQIIEGVDMNWTVKDLKTHLSRVYPTNPAETDQRLIYSGKLLSDHLPVRDVFRKMDTMPTLHLVCAFRTPLAAQQGARPKVKPAEQQGAQPSPHPDRQSTEGGTPPRSMPTMPTTDGLRHRGHPAPATPGIATPGAAGMTHPAFPTYSLYSQQQLLWLQHMYARQYYMQYHAAMAAAASAPVTPASATSLPVAPRQAAVPAALPNQAPIDNLPANQNAPDLINPEGANQNLRMNAQGGPVMEDEEELERDWLDWVYTVARLSVFLSIVYFYSSVSRFILVMSSLFLMYLHTAGWFPFRPRPLVRGPIQPAPEVIQNQQNQHQDGNPEPVEAPAEVEGAEAEVGPDGPHPLTAVLVPPVRVSVVWTAWVFFKAFFASLVPEGPQGVAN